MGGRRGEGGRGEERRGRRENENTGVLSQQQIIAILYM